MAPAASLPSAAVASSRCRLCASSVLVCSLAFATLNSGGGIHQASALRASDTSGEQLIAASSAVQREQQVEAAASGEGVEAKIPIWKKTLAAGAALGALSKRGGAEAFQIHTPRAAVASSARSTTVLKFGPNAHTIGAGTLIMEPEMPAFSVMTIPTVEAQHVLEQQVFNQQRAAWNTQSMFNTPDQRVRIGPKLGSGSFAEVFRGTYYPEDQPEGRLEVAVKKIERTPETERMVKREIRMMWELEESRGHDYSNWPILRLYGFEEHMEENKMWVVMDIADGDLESLVLSKNMEQVGFIDRIGIINELTHAIAMMNQKGYLHRDIKPQNVFIKKGYNAAGHQDLKVKLGDFGLACAVGSFSETLCLNDVELRQAAGSPLYMARERFHPDVFADFLRRDIRSPALKSDVFSIGMIFYQLMFNGRAPLEFFKYQGAPTAEFPEGTFDSLGWAAGFDIKHDLLFKHARAITQANSPEHRGVDIILTKVFDAIEEALSQNVEARPRAETLCKEGYAQIAGAIVAANLGTADDINAKVAARIGDILFSASQDPAVLQAMGNMM